MTKKLILFIVGLSCVALGLFFLWPLSFAEIIADDTELYVVLTDSGVKEGLTGMTTTEYTFQPDSEEFKQIRSIVSQYSFHRTLRTVFSDASTNGNDAGYFLSLYSRYSVIMSGGTGEIIVNNNVYRIGYWGNTTALVFMKDIRSVLEGTV